MEVAGCEVRRRTEVVLDLAALVLQALLQILRVAARMVLLEGTGLVVHRRTEVEEPLHTQMLDRMVLTVVQS